MTKSHARRFVRSAWTLLSFQLVASVGAVAVTGVAALHVSRLAAQVEAQTAPEAVEEAAVAPTEVTPQTPAAETPTEPAPTIAACQRVVMDQQPTFSRAQVNIVVFRVPANVEWCDTGAAVQEGQTLAMRAQGRWNHAGAPEYGPQGASGRDRRSLYPRAVIGALVGRIGERPFPIGEEQQMAAAASGTLQLSMNDVPGGFYDNQGHVDVAIQIAQAPTLQ